MAWQTLQKKKITEPKGITIETIQNETPREKF